MRCSDVCVECQSCCNNVQCATAPCLIVFVSNLRPSTFKRGSRRFHRSRLPRERLSLLEGRVSVIFQHPIASSRTGCLIGTKITLAIPGGKVHRAWREAVALTSRLLAEGERSRALAPFKVFLTCFIASTVRSPVLAIVFLEGSGTRLIQLHVKLSFQ